MERISHLLLTGLSNACWQIALITAVAALCAWLLRETSARYRHLLWVAALALCFCLPVLTGLRLSNGANLKIQSEPLAPVQQAVFSSAQIPLDPAGSIPSKKKISFIPVSRNLATGLVAIYFLFLCCRGAILFKAWRLTRAIARRVSTIELPEHVRTVAEQCQTALRVKRVRVLCSAAAPLPITLGGPTPIVILPEQLLLEDDRDVLTSAIGHELVHVRRRDYALNLFYELIYLPLSFHPAAALVRRRIRETRELSCDELVADRLLEPEVYARSLVKLAGSAMTIGRQTTITVGIADADILEERVMTILRRQKINVLRKNFLLAAATLLLAVPCMAALPLSLRIDINSSNSSVTPGQNGTQEAHRRKERARTGIEVVMPALSAETEAGTLAVWLKKPGETVQRGEAIARIATSKGSVDVAASTTGVVERLLVAVGEKAPAGSVIAIIRDQGWALTGETGVAQQEELERQIQAAAATTAQDAEQKVQEQAELERDPVRSITLIFDLAQKAKEQAELEQSLVERVAQGGRQTVTGTFTTATTNQPAWEQQVETLRLLRDANKLSSQAEGDAARAELEQRMVQQNLERVRAERETTAKEQAELAKQATLSMQQAIQIVTNQYPGTVLESRLVRERNQPCYLLMILSDNGTETTTTRVLISAVDGSVLKATKQ